jgi:Spy/CpxP family protein refolding chaperone
MRVMTLACLVVVALAVAVAPAWAGAPSTFEEAGRLVDQLASRLSAFGNELVQTMQPGHGPATPGGPMGGLMGGPMGRMGDPADRPLITMMLHHRAELGLSADQVGRLETLRGDFTREAIRRDADIRIAELDLAGLLEQDPVDLSKVEAKVREAAQLRADLRIARLRTVEQGKAVLTPEQRTRFQTMLSGGMQHGGMQHGSMPPGGMPQGSGGPPPPRAADTGVRL